MNCCLKHLRSVNLHAKFTGLKTFATFDSTYNMTSLIFIGFFWLAVIFLCLRYVRLFSISQLSPWLLPFGFLVKVIAGVLFIYVYTELYGDGQLTQDAGEFMRESKMLHDVFFTSPAAYFSLLTGIGESADLVNEFLAGTNHWSASDVALVNDSKNILRVHSIIHFISLNNEFVHVLFMCLFSVLGLRDLTIAFKDRIRLSPYILFIGLLLLPSVFFWGSSILKEPLLIAGAGLFTRALLVPGKWWKRGLRLLLALALLTAFKPYVFLCLLLAAVYYVFSRLVLRHHPWYSLLLFTGLGFGFLVAVPIARDKLTSSISRKQLDFDNVGKGGMYALNDSCMYYLTDQQFDKVRFLEDGNVVLAYPAVLSQKIIGSKEPFKPVKLKPDGKKWLVYYQLSGSDSYIHITMINNSFRQLILNIPEAFVNALLRPFPGDSGSWLKYPAILEVFSCISGLLLALIFRRKLHTGERRLLAAMVLFAVALLVIIGWITPVTGAIVRYRVPAYIAIFIITLFIIKVPEKWKRTNL